MPSFTIDIEHNGQLLETEVLWESVTGGGYFAGVSGLGFNVLMINFRETTPEERERLDEELMERYEDKSDTTFFERIGSGINEHGIRD